jgi:hypothetical protein
MRVAFGLSVRRRADNGISTESSFRSPVGKCICGALSMMTAKFSTSSSKNTRHGRGAIHRLAAMTWHGPAVIEPCVRCPGLSTMWNSASGNYTAAMAVVAAPSLAPPRAVEEVEAKIWVSVIRRPIEIAGRCTAVGGIVVISRWTRISVLGACGRGQHDPGNGNAEAEQNQNCAGQSSAPTHRKLRERCSAPNALAVEG